MVDINYFCLFIKMVKKGLAVNRIMFQMTQFLLNCLEKCF